MRITFDDKSFIEFEKNIDKYTISIGAKNFKNSLETIINSVELSQKEFDTLFGNIEVK